MERDQLPALLEGKVGITSSCGIAEIVVKKYHTLFFTYANTVTMDLSLGEVRFESTCGNMEMSVVWENFLQSHPAKNDTAHR